MSDDDLRFADRPSTSVQRTISADPATIWDRLTDITLPVAGSDELQHVTWLDGAEAPALGARFRGDNASGDAEWSTTSVVTTCTPPTADHAGEFAWTVTIEPDAEPLVGLATWGYEVEAVTGGTRVTQRVSVGPGRSGLTWAIRQNPTEESRIISGRLRWLRRGMDATLDALATEFGSVD